MTRPPLIALKDILVAAGEYEVSSSAVLHWSHGCCNDDHSASKAVLYANRDLRLYLQIISVILFWFFPFGLVLVVVDDLRIWA